MLNKTISYLRSIEWRGSQCSCCLGASPYEDQWDDRVGHLRSCRLAQALAELNQTVEWSRRNNSDTRKQFKQFSKWMYEKLKSHHQAPKPRRTRPRPSQ